MKISGTISRKSAARVESDQDVCLVTNPQCYLARRFTKQHVNPTSEFERKEESVDQASKRVIKPNSNGHIFAPYAEQISPLKVDDRGLTIVSGGKESASTTFCLSLGKFPCTSRPLLPLTPSNSNRQYFHSPGLAIRA